MSAVDEIGTALAVAEARPTQALAPPLGDDEIRRLFRVASALARSGMFKDVKQADQAFAKIVIGRDLGLTPAQAMTGVYLVEGRPQLAAPLMGHFVRASGKYDWRVLKIDRDGVEIEFGEGKAPGKDQETGEWLPWPGSLGVSEFTKEDAETAKLGGKDTYSKWPRNMFFSRAMSNGVKWFVPDTMGGLPVYVEGELEGISSGRGRDGDTEAAALPPAEETTPEALMGAIERSLPDDHPHALAERAFGVMKAANTFSEGLWTVGKVELTLKGKSLEAATTAIGEAEFELTRLREAAAAGEEEPADAEVVEPDAGEQLQAEPREEGEEPSAEDIEAVEVLRKRERELVESVAGAEPGSREAEELGTELDQVREQIRALGFTPSNDA